MVKKLYAVLLLSLFALPAFAAKDLNDNASNDMTNGAEKATEGNKSSYKRGNKRSRQEARESEAQREEGFGRTAVVGGEQTKNCGYTTCNKREHGNCGHCRSEVIPAEKSPVCEKWVRVTRPACQHIQTLKQYSYTCPTTDGYKMVKN